MLGDIVNDKLGSAIDNASCPDNMNFYISVTEHFPNTFIVKISFTQSVVQRSGV